MNTYRTTMKPLDILRAQISSNSGSWGDAYSKFTELYEFRLSSLTLIKQLIQMIKAMQRHRGMSMGLLGGNNSFQREVSQLQQQLTHRISLFQAFALKSKQLIPLKDQENLRSAWVTVSEDWQHDSVIDNYELHCHLIEQMLSLLATLGRQFEQPMSALLPLGQEQVIVHPQGSVYPNRVKLLEVLHFSTRLMPAVSEQIGRIRALSTYTAAVGICTSDYASKLRYVIQSAKVNNEKLRHQAKRMETILDKDSALLVPLKSYEIKLSFLLNMVEQEILTEKEITTDSHKLFDVASDIIDKYLYSLDQGVLLLESWHNEEIENWLNSMSD